jgi:hypothetical protein
MNERCVGTAFQRWGKVWAWCCRDGKIYELKEQSQKFCFACERFWDPVPFDKQELKRIQLNIDEQVDFPYYKTRTAFLEKVFADRDQAVLKKIALVALAVPFSAGLTMREQHVITDHMLGVEAAIEHFWKTVPNDKETP